MFEKLQKSLGDALDFPADVLGNAPKITIFGRHELVIENYSEIIQFSEETIGLATTEGLLTLSGKKFVLKTILPSELRIEGELDSLSYGGRGNP